MNKTFKNLVKELDERKIKPMYHHVLKGKVVASGSASNMRKLVKKNGKTVDKGPNSNYVLNSPGAKVGDIEELGGAYSYAYMDQHPVADLNAAKKKKKKEKVGEKFASDAQRKAAFARGYKAKGKKKK